MKYQDAVIKARNELHASHVKQCGEVAKLTKAKQKQFIKLCKYSSMSFDGGKYCHDVYANMLKRV
jgi:hypothetical protein